MSATRVRISAGRREQRARIEVALERHAIADPPPGLVDSRRASRRRAHRRTARRVIVEIRRAAVHEVDDRDVARCEARRRAQQLDHALRVAQRVLAKITGRDDPAPAIEQLHAVRTRVDLRREVDRAGSRELVEQRMRMPSGAPYSIAWCARSPCCRRPRPRRSASSAVRPRSRSTARDPRARA